MATPRNRINRNLVVMGRRNRIDRNLAVMWRLRISRWGLCSIPSSQLTPRRSSCRRNHSIQVIGHLPVTERSCRRVIDRLPETERSCRQVIDRLLEMGRPYRQLVGHRP